jgi:hypothetical protein
MTRSTLLLALLVLSACGDPAPRPAQRRRAPPPAAEPAGAATEAAPAPDLELAAVNEVFAAGSSIDDDEPPAVVGLAASGRDRPAEGPLDRSGELAGMWHEHEGSYELWRAGPDIAELAGAPLTVVHAAGTCRSRIARAYDVRWNLLSDDEYEDRIVTLWFFEPCHPNGGIAAFRGTPETTFRAFQESDWRPAPPELLRLLPDSPPSGTAVALTRPNTFLVQVEEDFYTHVIRDGQIVSTGILAPYAEVRALGRTILLEPTVSSDDIAFVLEERAPLR